MHTHTLWAARVAAGTVLPDKRLPARLASILETFAERPSDAIPQAAGSWGQAKGIYRFLANPRVQPAALQQGLTSDTARQCLDQTTVLVVQDTTSLKGYPETFSLHRHKIMQHPCDNETQGGRKERAGPA